jgi:hypothetical protein
MAAPQSSVFSRSYNSFSGVDIKAVFANKVMAEIQAISYSITREKAPIYTMGSADPRSFSRGKRGIAGTVVFVVFDRHTILSSIGGMSPDGGLLFSSDVDEIRPDYATDALSAIPQPVNVLDQTSTLNTGIGSDQALAGAWYVDQIPPFDVTLAAENEYGALAVMRIFGVELLNEGYGVSIDDMVSEQQFTYIARTIIGWTPVASPNIDAIANQGSSSGV